jgi:hypothetical protein
MPATFEQSNNPTDASSAAAGVYDQTFQTSGRARLYLDNPRGDVLVTGWDRSDVHVRAVKRHEGSPARYEATQVVFNQDGDTIIARTIADPTSSLAQRGVLTGVVEEIVRAFADLLPNNALTTPVDYDVHVPFDTELDLRAVSATVGVAGTRGAYKVRSVSGRIDVKDVKGDADLGSVSGDIEATGILGRVHVEEVSGNARLAGEVNALHAKTVSGDVELAAPLRAGSSYDARSVSGNLNLRIPRSTAATISVRGVSPTVHSELTGTVIRNHSGPGHREWEGQLGSGGASVRLQTVSGNLYLRALDEASVSPGPATPRPLAVSQDQDPSASQPAILSEPATPTPAANGEPAAPRDDRDGAELRILNALERGELSVEDALRQIEALSADQ